jgi:GT2 family glycosyltransferase
VHDNERTLARCLAALAAQLGADGEVICVDDASADGSAAVASAAGAAVARMAENVGAARARNAGAGAARGECLFFLDADVMLSAGALAALRRSFEAGADAVVGHYTAETPAPGFFSRYQNYYTFFNHDRQRGDINWFWTAMGAVRRGVFEELGGFSEHYRGASAEDMEFGYELSRAGRRIVLDKDVRGEHDHRHGFRSLVSNDLKKSAAWSNVFLRLNKRGRFKHGFTGAANRISLFASYGVLAGALAAVFVPAVGAVVAVASALAYLAANAPFFAFVGRRAGLPFLIGAAAFHYFTNLLIGLGVARGTLTYLFGAKVR